MSNVEKLSIALTSEMAETVKKCVKDGEYASNSEVIRDALRDWQIKRSFQQQELKKLQNLWQTGLDSGNGKFNNMEEIKAEARKRLLDSTN